MTILKNVEKDVIEAVTNYKQRKNPKFEVGDIVTVFAKEYDKWIRAKMQVLQNGNVVVWALDYGKPINVQANALIPLKGTRIQDSNGVGINRGGLGQFQPAKKGRFSASLYFVKDIIVIYISQTNWRNGMCHNRMLVKKSDLNF